MNFGWIHLPGWIDGYQPLVYCRAECLVEGGVDAVDGGGGEPWILAGAWLYAPALLKSTVQPPQIGCRKLGKFLLPR